MPGLQGLIIGLLAGILMGIVSEIGYQIGIFKSSLFIIDGSFVANILGVKVNRSKVYTFGIPLHLITSMVFGGVYKSMTDLLNWNPHAVWILTSYIIILWLSMALVALPISGQGFLGKKGGRFAWLEQLLLHIVYGTGLWLVLSII
jgi:hypothetical protein